MTPQEKLIAISGYLPYGLKFISYDLNKKGEKINLRCIKSKGLEFKGKYLTFGDSDGFTNHRIADLEKCNKSFALFPIACLYKEIRVKSYNNGEPFIPIVELAKVIWGQYEWVLSEDGRFAVSNTGGVYKDFKYQPINEVFNINGNPTIYHLQIYDLLNSWYIDYRGSIEQGEAISVLDINPNLYA